jgi:hypothetical protein
MDMDTLAGTATIYLHVGVDHTTVRKRLAGVPAGFMVLANGSGTTAAEFFKHAPFAVERDHDHLAMTSP